MGRDTVQLETAQKAGEEYSQCYTKPLDSLKNWNNRFFWVDERVFSTVVDWRTNAPKDGMPAAGTYSLEAVRVLDTHRTPIQKQLEMVLFLVGIRRRYYLGDEVTNCRSLTADMDLFNLIRAQNPTKVKVGSRPRAPHEVPLLTLTAPRVIEMDEPAATDSSSVPSTIERSPLDFAHKAGASDQGVAAPEIPSFEDRDHADPRSSGSSHGGKSLAAIQLGLASTVVPEDAPVGVSDPDPLSFADAPSRHPADVAQSSPGIAAAGDRSLKMLLPPLRSGLRGVYISRNGVLPMYNVNLARQVVMGSQLRLRFEQEAKLLRKSVAQVARRDKRIQARELEIKNLEVQLETEAEMKKAVEGKSARLIKELEDLHARFSDLQVSNEHLSQQVATLQEQAFADVVSAGVAKGMSEGLKHGVEHGQAQLKVESIEAYDPEAETKFIAALQSLKDLKYPLLDRLEGLKDASMDVIMDVIMAALYLESDTWGMPHNIYATSAPAHHPRVSGEEKMPHSMPYSRVGSAHHARSDGVLVSVPTMVPQGLALLLVDAATQTDLEDT
nr:hypothetical protein [Tanacetum cinerariifolium]